MFSSLRRFSSEFKDYGSLIAPANFARFLDTYTNREKSAIVRKLLAVWKGKIDYCQASLLSELRNYEFNEVPLVVLSRCLLVPINELIRIPSRWIESFEESLEDIFLQLCVDTRANLYFNQTRTVEITEEALQLWADWRQSLDQTQSEGFAQWLRIIPVNVLRIALILHGLYYLADETPLDCLEVKTMSAAIHLGKWLTIQAKNVFNG
jgi:hypothetical protein